MDRFIVSARKYRPVTFADVVGQASITTTLKNSILNDHLGHAYLFSGPRGVGKTTCARIFARTINCAEPTGSGEPCNACESCLSFTENRSYNIHELDAASNNSVDDIRVLTEQVRIPPQVGKFSVYIIDEVHMLSPQAFNAFLKTLEEPPAHAVFILATTEKHKIIPTILSRCQIFDFNRIRVEDAAAYLKGIAEKESIGYEEEALHVIAQKADGALRDALSIFDQVVSFSGKKITYKDVIRNLNILDYDYYFRLTASALESDASSMLLLFNEVLTKGFDARNFINGYAAHLRDLLVCKDPATVQLMEVGAGIREKYLSQATKVPVPFLYEGLEICNQADIQVRSSRNQRLTIELALVRLASLTADQKKKSVAETGTREARDGLVSESGETQEGTTGNAGTAPSPGKEPAAGEEPAPDDQVSPGKAPSPDEEPAPGEPVGVVKRPTISIRDQLKGSDATADQTDDGIQPDDRADEAGGSPDTGRMTAADPDRIMKAWNEYATSIKESLPRVFSTMNSNKPAISSDGSIRLLLNSEAQQEHFIKNIRPELAGFICRATGMEHVEITAGVMEGPENGKKIYTEQDKLDFLAKKNPEVAQLKTRFNLDFDD